MCQIASTWQAIQVEAIPALPPKQNWPHRGIKKLKKATHMESSHMKAICPICNQGRDVLVSYIRAPKVLFMSAVVS
jgi:hypothetical protein